MSAESNRKPEGREIGEGNHDGGFVGEALKKIIENLRETESGDNTVPHGDGEISDTTTEESSETGKQGEN